MDPKVILESAKHREEVSAIEVLLLMQDSGPLSRPIIEAANELNRRAHGDRVTFIRSKQIHLTNICRAECSFCSFWKSKGQRNAFTLTPAQLVRAVRDSGNLNQISIQGGLNPDLTAQYYVDCIRAVKSEFHDLHVQGLSPSEIHFMARRSRTPSPEILRRLREAGMDSLSGDSADILNDKIRKKLSPDKLRTHDWIEIVKAAHRLGMTTTATMMFGHIEDEIHISEHLDIIKNVQRETGGFTSFEAIPFVGARTELAQNRSLPPVTLERILKVIAVARIFFGKTLRNITIDWTKVGLATALRALWAGANDIGPLAVDAYEIRSSAANGKLAIPVQSLQSAIRNAGRVPVEREPYSWKSITFRPRKEEPVLV